MTVFNYFLKMFWRKKLVFIIYIGIFFFVNFITLNQISREDTEDFEKRVISIAVYQEEDSELGEKILERFQGNKITFLEDTAAIREEMLLSKYDIAILMKKDMEERLLNGEEVVEVLGDPGNGLVQGYGEELDQYLAFLAASYDGAFHYDAVEKALSKEVDVEYLQGNSDEKSADDWLDAYVRFSAYVLSAIIMVCMGQTISDFQEQDIAERNNISGKKYSGVAMEIYLGQLVLSLFIVAFQVLAVLFYQPERLHDGSLWPFALNLLIFNFAILGMTNLITSFTGKTAVISGVGNILPLGMSFISGIFVQKTFLSPATLNIARFFPTYYFVENVGIYTVQGIFNKNTLLMALYGVLCLLLSLYVKREKLAQE